MSYFETLPQITDRQEFICDEGHGACEPVQREFEYYREEDFNGNVTNIMYETVWCSSCCNAGISVWDNDKEDVVIE